MERNADKANQIDRIQTPTGDAILTPTDAARKLLEAIADNHPLTRDAILNKYGEAIALALVAAEEWNGRLSECLQDLLDTTPLEDMADYVRLRIELVLESTTKGGE